MRDRTGKSARIAEKIRKKIGIDIDIKPETVTEENVVQAEAPKEEAPNKTEVAVEAPKEEAPKTGVESTVDTSNKEDIKKEQKSESLSEKK